MIRLSFISIFLIDFLMIGICGKALGLSLINLIVYFYGVNLINLLKFIK